MTSTAVKINTRQTLSATDIQLPASKSESNRALIIAALCKEKAVLSNLSEARDTQTMQRLLGSSEEIMDVLDAGTTMRFLTAYFAVTGQEKTLTGTPRMQERPVGILVDALRELGAGISYLKKDGYPPHKITSPFRQKTNSLNIRGDVSSQYISALLMIAPALPEGLNLRLSGKVGSRPYIEMTLQLMQRFGVQSSWKDDTISVPAGQAYQAGTYQVESDWSGASYWLSQVALAEEAEINLLGLRPDSLQGDIRILEIMEGVGVGHAWEDNKLKLFKKAPAQAIEVDFTHCPDLAQTVAVACAAKGIKGRFSGLESLRIKETDRIAALQNELKKIGAGLTEPAEGSWELHPSKELPPGPVQINTYEDHRMAMAFAPLATRIPLIIEEPEVVNKSYPRYWENLESAGYTLEFSS